MDAIGCRSYGDYLDYLEVHPEVYEQLFDTLLINVTEFFRDPATWDYLRDEALPALLAAKPHEEPVRVWCAGCASAGGLHHGDAVRRDALARRPTRELVKIYATDVDEDALKTARLALYTDKEVQNVPEPLARRSTSSMSTSGWAFARTCGAR